MVYQVCTQKVISVFLQMAALSTKVRMTNEAPLAKRFASAASSEVSTRAVSTRESAWPN